MQNLNISSVPSIYMRFSFLRSQLYILETIVEHVIQATKVTFSPACEGPQNDSFSAIFVDSDEDGNASVKCKFLPLKLAMAGAAHQKCYPSRQS